MKTSKRQSPHFRAELSPAPPITLHGRMIDRTDANSPVVRSGGERIIFFSHYQPKGHTYRRSGPALDDLGPAVRVTLVNDPDPGTGKWIESVWAAPDDRLYGWYHAEELAPCPRRLFVSHIGAIVSEDRGSSWRVLGEVLRSPPGSTDCSFRNGFFAGGYGDFCVLPDRDGRYFYLLFTSYIAAATAQGVSVARFPTAARDAPWEAMELWTAQGWQPGKDRLPDPIFPARRGWTHADPEGFWGPSVHYNRSLGAYAMLLNHTAGGNSDLRQEGIYCAFNTDLSDPRGWTDPQCLMAGGGWYPEIIGNATEDGDALASSPARFFFCGYSAWDIRFTRSAQPLPPVRPVVMTRALFQQQFGPKGSFIVA